MTYANDMSSVAPAPSRAVRTPRPAALAADLRLALMRSVRRIRFERSSEVITDGQYSVLAALDKLGPLTPRALAERDHVQPPSMTRTLNALVEAGLVAREEHPGDRRQVLVRVTEPGRLEVKETRQRRDAWLARRLAELDPGERQVLADAAAILLRVVAR